MRLIEKYGSELLIASAAAVSYVVCLANDFHTDDWIVLRNYSDGLSWIDFLSMENLGRFRPLTNILLYFRFLAFGDNPGPYYALNIILHIVACNFFYRFLLRIGLEKLFALTAALIFAVYFPHYEGVLWLYGTIRIFAAIFWIAGLWALYRFVEDGRAGSLALFAAISFLGLFVVEDIVVAPFGFAVFAFLFTDRTVRWRRFRPVLATGVIGLAVYFVLRSTLIVRPGVVEQYYYLGPHIFSRLVAYFEWMALPPPDHSYFQRLSSRLSPAAYGFWDIASIVLMAGLMAYTAFKVFRGSRPVRFFAFFVFLTLLPVLPLDYKVTSRNLYLPSIGLSVVLAGLFLTALKSLGSKTGVRRALISAAVIYALVSIAATWITSLEYRKNQTLVASMVADVRASGVDLGRCDFVLLDHMPGRTIIGPTLMYRFGYIDVVVASNDPVSGPVDIPSVVRELCSKGMPFVVFDYRHGHLVESTENYVADALPYGEN